MTLAILIVAAGLFTFFSLKGNSFVMAIAGAGMWLVVLVYMVANPPLTMPAGSASQEMMLFVLGGAAVATLIGGVTRTHNNREAVERMESRSYAEEDREEEGQSSRQVRAELRRSKSNESTDDYQNRIHRILHPPRKRA